MTDKETRVFAGPIEVRTKEGEPKRIVGYAAVFNSQSEDLGGFREILVPGAFDRALSEEQDVRALFNHDPSKVLGRTKSGTLKLSIDKRGLKVDLEPGNSPTALEVMDRLERGDLDGMSFGFKVVTDEWRTEERNVIREVRDLDLFDVSVVAFPAYPATEVSARALEMAKEKAPLPFPIPQMTSSVETINVEFERVTEEPRGVPNEINLARLKFWNY